MKYSKINVLLFSKSIAHCLATAKSLRTFLLAIFVFKVVYLLSVLSLQLFQVIVVAFTARSLSPFIVNQHTISELACCLIETGEFS